MTTLWIIALSLGIGAGLGGVIGIFVEPTSDVPPRFLLAGVVLAGVGWQMTRP